MIDIKINNQKIVAKPGQTIAEAAKANGIEIPLLCYHPDLEIKANCRICVVEVKGCRDLQTACSTEIKQGMEIFTETERVQRARKINLELIFSQHKEECDDCVWKYNCQLLELAKKYKVKINRFADRKRKFPSYQFGGAVEFDSSKCIDCRNCIEVCEKQGVGFLELQERGHLVKVVPSRKKNKDCIYCGQCIIHCPAGAFEAAGEFEEITKPLASEDKIVVAQLAPSIRTSLGEEFGLEYGEVVTAKIASALKKLGFNYVFDTCVGADFTTTAEADEAVERLKSEKNLPMLNSCCPAWVRYVEFYYPEFIPNLTTVRSPQAILGGLIKTYWAKKVNINPKKIVVVSIMPCVAKKFEINRPELKIDGLKPIDIVLTTRELARLMKKNKIDLKKLEPANLDDMFGEPSGAGVIYGATGGVMESVFRTVYEKATGQKLKDVEFKQIRGMAGCKKAEVKLGKKTHRIAVVNGLGGAKKILEEVRSGKSKYSCIEVMACPGGCIGGGGQPVPTDAGIRQKRAAGLYAVDSKKKVRQAHENPIVKEVYSEFFDHDEKMARAVLHTRFYRQKKGRVRIS